MCNLIELVRHNGEEIGIIKAYMSVTGNGAFPTELKGKQADVLIEHGREYQVDTGKKNRCGWLDLILIKDEIKRRNITTLGISHLEVIGKLSKQEVCVMYRSGVRIMNKPPENLEKCIPMYQTFFGGWEMEHCRKWNKIPFRAKEYVRHISMLLGYPIQYIRLDLEDPKIIRNMNE